jgi:hypothetical protein
VSPSAVRDDAERAPPAREGCYLVFAQTTEAHANVEGWDAHAHRFFRTRIGLESGEAPALRLVITPAGEPPAVRWIFARPREAEDLVLAEAADPRGSGMALLARRCPTVWLVAREGDSSDDRAALRLAAVLASVFLGPILDVRVPELLGVKSARARLDRS